MNHWSRNQNRESTVKEDNDKTTTEITPTQQILVCANQNICREGKTHQVKSQQ